MSRTEIAAIVAVLAHSAHPVVREHAAVLAARYLGGTNGRL
jgi:hypothetical protein